jgi:hypothetical protein
MGEILVLPKKVYENGYYLRRHEKWQKNMPSTLELIHDGKIRGQQDVRTSVRNGFVYQRVFVYTGKQIDELLLEAYMAGAEGKAFDPVLLMSAREDNSSEHATIVGG